MLRGMFLVRRGACSFSRNFCFVLGTKILHNVENSAAPRRIVTRQTDIGAKKKEIMQGCSCNRRQKSMTSCTWDATHPSALDLGTPEGSTAQSESGVSRMPEKSIEHACAV